MNIIMVVLPVIMPYIFLGENICSLILTIIAATFLIIKRKTIEINKLYINSLLIFLVIILLTQIFISPYIESFSGIFIYVNMILYYLVFLLIINKSNRDILLKYMVIAITVVLLFFIVYEGLYFKIRVSGNLMYANSYALLLLCAIYFNYIRREDILTDYLESILFLGILFTQSRTTLILFLVFLFLKIRNEVFKKKEKVVLATLPTLFAIMQYIIYTQMDMASLLILPIIIYSYKYIKIIAKKINFKVYLLCSIIIILFFIFSGNDLIERLKELSLKSATLQERLIYYEDALKTIIKSPRGNGINMFGYKSYDGATAFYDVKYIHNSILQIAYDSGVISALIFIFIIAYGMTLIWKNISKERVFFLSIYVTIIIHSLMDFDFAFSSITILLVFIIVLSNMFKENSLENREIKQVEKIYNCKMIIYYIRQFSFLAILLLSVYCTIYEGAISLGKIYSLNNRYSESNKIYSFASKIGGNFDGRSYFFLAENYKNINDLDNALFNLNRANEIYPFNPMNLWNMAYIYEQMGIDSKVIELRNELLDREKYNGELYLIYNQYLENKYEETKEEKYRELILMVKGKYEEAKNTINRRAKNIYNQIIYNN